MQHEIVSDGCNERKQVKPEGVHQETHVGARPAVEQLQHHHYLKTGCAGATSAATADPVQLTKSQS